MHIFSSVRVEELCWLCRKKATLVFQNAVEYLVSLIGRLPCIQICSSFRIEVFRWHQGLILQDRWNIWGKRPREKAKFICFDCDDFGGGFGDGDGAREDMIGGWTATHVWAEEGENGGVFGKFAGDRIMGSK